jgi:hypothetical protein
MILRHNNRPFKLIPARYLIIENITDYLENFEEHRLTEAEREYLDEALFKQAACKFIETLEKTNPLVFDQVKDSKPTHAVQFRSGSGEVFYALRMMNGINVRCIPEVFKLSHVKERITYASSFPSISITKNEATQLTLFDQ